MRNSIFFTVAMVISILFLYPFQSHALFKFFGGDYTAVKSVNGEVMIPLKSINDGRAHYFSFTRDNRKINFFVVKSRDNVIRAAFDACDVCFRERKGYSQNGDYMICNNCGQRFHSTRINVVKGGCNPAPLLRTQRGNDLVIRENDILSGSRYF